MELKGKKLAFLGDSITEGCGTSGVEKNFVSLIAKLGDCTTVNYGIGGTRIARQIKPTNERWDLDFCMRVEELDGDADAVVVFGGTNDFGHGDAPIGMFTDRDVKTFYGACHHLMTRLLERFPGKPILILTPLHRSNEDNLRGDGMKAYDTGDLKKYVGIIREMAEYYSIPLLDLYAESGLQPKVDIIKASFMPDGLHPNDAGHVLLADKIYRKLLAL